MTRLLTSLLGPFRVTLDGETVTNFATDKARALWAYLVVQRDRPHHRDALAGLLWPDQPQRKARQNLRQALLYLRQAVGDQRDGLAEPFLLINREAVQVNPDSDYWLDVAAFAALIAAVESHSHRRLETCRSCRERLKQAIDLYRGEFLAQLYIGDSVPFEEWMLLQREWLRRQAVEALFHLANHHEQSGEYRQARRYAWRQVELEPWREEAHRQLMRLLALDGQRSAALAQYEACCRVLAQELGIQPTAATTALYESIRAGQHIEAPVPPHNLAPAATSFIAREEELLELADLMANPDCRLVTLVGPGGIGKSRLALRAAQQQLGSFADGVFMVPLTPIGSVEFLPAAVADALNFVFHGSLNPKEQLLNYLRQKELLLVLDSMEQLVEGADFLAEILRRSPNTVLLVTSRERLYLHEEWVYSVSGLPYPTNATLEAGRSFEPFKGCSAIELFLQSARRARRDLALSEQDMSYVVRICQLVEGMPLGVELAAAGVSIRSCREIAQEIERNLDTLATAWRNVPERHRSMRATFEYSWSMLTEQERKALAKLSVFRGGFDCEAAECVAGASLSVLSSLVHKSLLRHDTSGRFQVHRLLRQFAAEKLEQALQHGGMTRDDHAGFFAAFVQQREAALQGEGRSNALQQIWAEIDNVRHAWLWAMTQIEPGHNGAQAGTVLERLVRGLYLFYTARGWYEEGKEAFDQAIAVLDNDGLASENGRLLGNLLAYQGKCCEFTEHSDKAQQLYERSLALLQQQGIWRDTALPLHGLGYMAHIKGEYARADRFYRESMQVYSRLEDPWGIASVLSKSSLVARRKGAFSEAKRRSEESLAIRREIGDQEGVSSSLSNLGLIYCDMGEYAKAKEVLQESLQICHQLDYNVGIANALTGLCQAAFRLRESQQAEAFGEKSLAAYREIGDFWGVAIALNNLGRMAAELGDHGRAKRFYQEGIAVYRQTGIKSGLANTLGNLGEACYCLGEIAEARKHLHEALQVAHEIGAIPNVLKNLVWLAPLLAQNGSTARGLELLSFALHRPEIAHDIRQQASTLFSELAGGLSAEEVAAVEARGRARTLTALVPEILSGELSA